MNPQNLTEKQIRKLKKLAGVMDNGNIAILEHLLEIEEKIDDTNESIEKKLPALENIIDKVKGVKGDKGDKGDKGEDGRDGIDGVGGKDGRDGIDGKDGKNGLNGLVGPQGVPGKDGRDGIDGKDGKDGFIDESTVAYLEDEIKKLDKKHGGYGQVIRKLQAGTNVTIDDSNIEYPIINATGGGGSGHTIEDEGTPLTTRTKLNFVGAGVTVTDDSGDDATVVTISGGGSGAVDSVNGETGVVTLTTDDISDTAQTNKWATAAEKTKLSNITVTQAVDLDAIETASHAAVTVVDTAEIDLALSGQQISASIVAGSIDETKLDASVNASLDLADSASQPGHTHTAANVTDFTEAAQDAVGAMVATSIVYNDAGATLQRAALSGAITATQDSNTTALGSFTKAQLDTAVSDGNVMYIGDAPTAHTHLLAAGATDVTATATELNYVDGVTSPIQSQIDAKPTISSGAGTPASTPTKVGDIYIDTTGDDAYIAVGTASSADWEKSNDGAGGGLSDGDKGDITVSSSGATWTIDNSVVSLAKQADVATSSVFYRKTAGTGAPEVQTLATLKTDLGLTGTNTGDQTSIVGITGTKAQFDTAVTDGNILYVGDITQYTDELAQDAVGSMVDASLTYVDGTPLLQRAALTGAVTATAGSNATSLGSFTKAQLDTAVSDGNVLYVGDVTTNATHTGEVTGSGALTLDATAITNRTIVTAVGSDYVLISDTSDSGLLKRALASDLAGGGGVSDGDKGDIVVSSSGTVWDIDTGVVGVTELSATGTPSATTFLRGDNTWATPAGGGGVTLGQVTASYMGYNMV